MKILSRTPNDFYENAETWLVRSDHVDQLFKIWITPPAIPLAGGGKAGAVYTLDGNHLAGVLSGVLRILGGTELPPLYGIAIGYPDTVTSLKKAPRMRDMTPTEKADNAQFIALSSGHPALRLESGGANAFLAFIQQELRPTLEAEYPLDPGDCVLTGASLGGLFTLYAFLSNPEGFRRYLPISPSIWWDDRMLLKQAQALVASRVAPAADIAMFAAELEGLGHVDEILSTYFAPEVVAQMPPEMRDCDMHGDMEQMAAILKTWHGEAFKVSTRIIPRESHQSIMGGAALSQGLRTLYGRLNN